MIDIGDKFIVSDQFASRQECKDGNCYEEVVDKESHREHGAEAGGDIVVRFDLERRRERDDEVLETYTGVRESSLERAIQGENLIPVEGSPRDYIRASA